MGMFPINENAPIPQLINRSGHGVFNPANGNNGGITFLDNKKASTIFIYRRIHTRVAMVIGCFINKAVWLV